MFSFPVTGKHCHYVFDFHFIFLLHIFTKKRLEKLNVQCIVSLRHFIIIVLNLAVLVIARCIISKVLCHRV